jgi:DNA-binding Lrp family transcriptional regulator
LITNQRTIHALTHSLSDDYSTRILISAVLKGKSVEDLSRENDIPLSTCYRRVHELLEDGMLVVERIVVTPDGKKYELLRSAFKSMSLRLENGQIVVDAIENEEIADKLHEMWMAVRWQDQIAR